MDVTTWIDALREQGDLLTKAAGSVSPDTDVPSCPEWRVRDLVVHTGWVHRWNVRIIAEQRTENGFALMTEMRAAGPQPSDDALLDWFAEGHTMLIDTLRTAPADLVCMTYVPSAPPVPFWARRQAHETAIHRVDAEQAARARTPIDPELAADGVDELLTLVVAMGGGRLRFEVNGRLQLSTLGRTWLVRLGTDSTSVTELAEPGAADCTVSGDPAALYLALWNRAPWEELTVTGDATLPALWSEKVHIGS